MAAMHSKQPRLAVLNSLFTIHQLPPGSPIPPFDKPSHFYSITETIEELSLVCDASIDIQGSKQETGWKIIKLEGPLDFSLIGILANISNVLAKAKISIFAVSTFATDYVLIKEKHLDKAIQVLRKASYEIRYD